MITFQCSTEDHELAQRITNRALLLYARLGLRDRKQDILMDIVAVHANGCPLRLDELLHADDANFGHDVLGIRRYLDRQTGQLTNCFVPRFAAPVTV